MSAAVFYEISFPDVIASGAEMTMRSRTSVTTAGGGGERRNKRWSRPLRFWNAARGIRTTEDLEAVRDFHIVVGGRHAGFRFRDFTDYRAVGQLLDTSAGGATAQLRKGYTAGGVTRWRTITKPGIGAVDLYLNGRSVQFLSPGSSGFDAPLWGEMTFGDEEQSASIPTASIDYTTGIITFTNPSVLLPSDILTSTFEFDVPARFDSDDFRVRAVARGNSWEYSDFLIKELR